MIKKALFGLFVLSFLVAPLALNAQSADDIAQLIAKLEQQIAYLKQQLAQLQGNQSGAFCYTFENNLGVGSGGKAVDALHTILVKEGFTISPLPVSASAGASYAELEMKKIKVSFTEATAAAVSGFQLKYAKEILAPLGLTNPTGYVGPATRAVLNRLYGCKYVIPPPPPPPGENLRVISPNGGESWQKGTSQLIQWSWKMSLYLSTNARTDRQITIYLYPATEKCRVGEICPLRQWKIAGGIIPDLGYYKWVVGKTTTDTPPAGSYIIDICSPTDSGQVCDKSDSYFKIYDSDYSGNKPPTISEVSGPTALKIGETGTWTVQASDPENGPLSYSVIWGDEGVTAPGRLYAPSAEVIQQTATFTHSYAQADTYYPKFKVTDNAGQSNSASISVSVGRGAVITPELKITPENLPPVVKGQYYNQIPFYSQFLKAEGFSSGNLTWSIISGTLPNGFSLNKQRLFCTAVVGSSCPNTETYSAFIYGGTENVTLGTYTFIVQATNGIQTARRQYILQVLTPVAL